MRFENLSTHFEEILQRESERVSIGDLRVVGSTNPSALAFLIAHLQNRDLCSMPQLVVFPDSQLAQAFIDDVYFFDPLKAQNLVHFLPHFDVELNSGLDPKTEIIAQRIQFLWRAQNAKPSEIFVCSIESLLQKTLPFAELANKKMVLRKNSIWDDSMIKNLQDWGFSQVPFVEDFGQFSVRGGLVDLFSPTLSTPVRIELFGDRVESLRTFSAETQISLKEISQIELVPAREVTWSEQSHEKVLERIYEFMKGKKISTQHRDEFFFSLNKQNYVEGIDFLLPFFYEKLESPLDHFSVAFSLWLVDPDACLQSSDRLGEEGQKSFEEISQLIRPEFSQLYSNFTPDLFAGADRRLEFRPHSAMEELNPSVQQNENQPTTEVSFFSSDLKEFNLQFSQNQPGSDLWLSTLKQKIFSLQKEGYFIFLTLKNHSQLERMRLFLEKCGLPFLIAEKEDRNWQTWLEALRQDPKMVYLIEGGLTSSLRLKEENLVFIREETLFGKKTRVQRKSPANEFFEKSKQLHFGDLKPGDYVVHTKHGIGLYEGLKLMPIQGVENEFIQLTYKDKDKLYLPIYRIDQIQKYAGAESANLTLDKLGGQGFEKTKVAVRGHVRDLAHDLLQLYAKRKDLSRPSFSFEPTVISAFESTFPFEETDDQLRAIQDVYSDLQSTKPMDRLVCGDVGFGKTEVALRAAFLAIQSGKQVALLAPTTVLTFQHFETFKRRYAQWPIEIRALNRFIESQDIKKSLKELKEGKIQMLIGTHRLLSKDVQFNNLGLLIIDEEQKFGVLHKERIRKLKADVDTLTLSATPIPRTLNMSLMGLRDLSLITSAPQDRLPTRTFVSEWNEDTIRKSIQSEIQRGGQVFFIHNRVQSIYRVADELRQLIPDVRLRVAHGQMEEHELEKTMIEFFQHEIDLLLCTTIIESGIDIPRANTMFIDQAQMMGVSQLYQLRGRVGRSKQRAYCYLLLPRGRKIDKDAQDRLKVLQENTALGSGIRIAQYDLELRGAGDILGEDQSGHIQAVGYEMYLDLLNEAVLELKGEPIPDAPIDPEINLRIQALIPESFIGDLRVRLSYYKSLSEIKSPQDLETIETELKDRFGELPDPVLNLMGVMLIRQLCKELGIKDLSAGTKSVSLVLIDRTPLKTETILKLISRENKKYSITPDQRLNIRINNIKWMSVYEELKYLQTLA